MTPHIEAKKGDYAPTVLMPGDPLRAKWIAETFLEDCKQVNGIRNCLGYTGYYNNSMISVQASGMGQASLGIYTHELYNFYDVETIIRVGSCGGMAEHINVGDIVVAMTAHNESIVKPSAWPCANIELLNKLVDNIPEEKVHHVGPIVSTDQFYNVNKDWWKPLAANGILAVEMEAHLLYKLAIRFNKKALAVCTVSDLLNRKESMSPVERETGFGDMIKIVLDTI